MPDSIQFYFRGKVSHVDSVAPTRTLLQHLREDLHCTGTKEGCAEGDCGACMVVVGELENDQVVFKPINSCIQLLPTLDGKAIFTVEDVRLSATNLHPVQQAMVDCHGSQCGFCTPGFVMSLWAMYHNRQNDTAEPTRGEINDALSGNLCRCTGYRPIIDAAHRMMTLPKVAFDMAPIVSALKSITRSEAWSYRFDGHVFHAPQTLTALIDIVDANPEARLLAGSTDIGLWITKQFRQLGDIIYLGQVNELRQIVTQTEWVEIGAGVSLEATYNEAVKYYPLALGDMRQRFASLPIRRVGTIGGNLANGSPIGDSMPWMIALGSQLVLRSKSGRRIVSLDTFYLDYQKKDLRPGEFIEAVRLPLPTPDRDRRFRTYKIAKRFDQDISAVCAAFYLSVSDGVIVDARIAFGGMAATPKRALTCESALLGQVWQEAVAKHAMEALEIDFFPLSDMRASAGYRMKVAQNLLYRFWLETRDEAPLAPSALSVFAIRDSTP